jgi:hypothetical protein
MRDPVDRFLKERGYLTAFETSCGCWGYCDIVAARFGVSVSRFRPDCEVLMAVELKLDDVAGVLNQCRQNRAVVNFSCAAMPRSRVNRMRPHTITAFEVADVGLLAVDDDSGECEFCVLPESLLPLPDWRDSYERLVDKMWKKVRKEYHAARAIPK